MLGVSKKKVYIFNKSYRWQYEVAYWQHLINYDVAMFGLKISFNNHAMVFLYYRFP